MIRVAAALLLWAACSSPSHKPALENAPTMPTSTWTIKSGAVGPLVLGEGVPASMHDHLERTYVGKMIADGVAIDGFELAEPAILVAFADGPFAKHDLDGTPVPPLDKLRAEAAAAVRAKHPVTRLFVRGAGPRTERGVGVGSDLAALRAAYRDLRVNAQPATMGEDRCAAHTKELPDVGFIFASCDAADAGGKVLRVDLWMPE
ncbi:MAG: hypothetical protein KIT31_07045 [Deltaproteobacteria bacterium]|nr:hypothetical protein [Deltaproteobacteria bacterium]